MNAEQLRTAFREIPKADREANEPFCIRVWRSLSWLERAESIPGDDIEGRFISCWIGVNALYGRLDDEHKPWGDHEALGTFIAQVWRLDSDEQLRRMLGKREPAVLKLIENKYLTLDFWLKSRKEAERAIQHDLKKAILDFRKPNRLSILRMLFERLHVMRNQLFHGASTKGSKLNRRTLASSAAILLDLLPICLEIMIVRGIQEDWGELCFPPVE